MDTEYLQKTVAGPLAQALSSLVVQQPSDPVEFVAMYLRKHMENEQREAKLQEDKEELAKQREEHEKRLEEERLRREEEERLRQEEEERQEAERLRLEAEMLEKMEEEERRRQEEIAQLLKEQEEKAQPKETEEGETIEGELPDELLEAKFWYNKAKDDVVALDPSKLAEIRGYKVANKIVHRVMKALFYIIAEVRPAEVSSWDDIRALLGKRNVLKEVAEYDPMAIQKKLKFENARRVVGSLKPEPVKKVSYAVYVVYQWIQAVRALRKQAVEARRAALQEGEAAEDLEEDDEPTPAVEGEEITSHPDYDEEIVDEEDDASQADPTADSSAAARDGNGSPYDHAASPLPDPVAE